jgi:dCTP deaminase
MPIAAQTLRLIRPVEPFCERSNSHGMTYGLGPAGYDVRIAENIILKPGAFALASTIERFCMPDDVLGTVHDKSTWARQGLAAQTTVIEPGWRGYLTLELTNHSYSDITLREGMPIAQVIFWQMSEPTEIAYRGKYQDQPSGAQPALFD